MTLTFKHSGRLGDIVYALPLIKAMAEKRGEAARLFIPSDVPSRLGGNVYHPGGDVMINQALFDFIRPLLEVQPYLAGVRYVKTAELPAQFIDLDAFKSSGLNLKAGVIHGWYRKAFGVAFPLEAAWLTFPLADSDATPQFDVLVNRSTRYCNTSINYGVLAGVPRVGYIGLDYEYEEFVRTSGLAKAQHVVMSDALQLARHMKRARVYVGNQSVCFAIAEGLKVVRALEAFEPVPVATPVGGRCTDYTRSDALATFVEEELGIRLQRVTDFPGSFQESIKAQEGWRPPLRKRLRQGLRQMFSRRRAA